MAVDEYQLRRRFAWQPVGLDVEEVGLRFVDQQECSVGNGRDAGESPVFFARRGEAVRQELIESDLAHPIKSRRNTRTDLPLAFPCDGVRVEDVRHVSSPRAPRASRSLFLQARTRAPCLPSA